MRNNICILYLVIWPFCVIVYTKLLKLVDECQQYSKLKHRRFRACTEKTISGVHVSPGSAETLVRRGGIRNNHVIMCSFSNISANNYRNRLMRVKVTKCNITVVSFETRCRCATITPLKLKLRYSNLFWNASVPNDGRWSNWGRVALAIIKPFHSYTNPENLMKVRPVVPEILCLIGRPLNMIVIKHWQNI